MNTLKELSPRIKALYVMGTKYAKDKDIPSTYEILGMLHEYMLNGDDFFNFQKYFLGKKYDRYSTERNKELEKIYYKMYKIIVNNLYNA